MNPSVNSNNVKGVSQGMVTITIPVNVSHKYVGALKCQTGEKDLNFENPEVCLAALVCCTTEYFSNKATGTPRDLFSTRGAVINYEALGSKGLVITATTSKSMTVLKKICAMFAQHYVPNKMWAIYNQLAKYRATSPLGEKGKKAYAWASNQLTNAVKNADVMLTSASKLDEKKVKEVMKKKYKAEQLPGGVKPSVAGGAKKSKSTKKDEPEPAAASKALPAVTSTYETNTKQIGIASGIAAVLVKHYLAEYKYHSVYDGSTLYVFVPPSQWKTAAAKLKKRQSDYVKKWGKMGKSLGLALYLTCAQSGLCTSKELNSVKANPTASDISNLLDKLGGGGASGGAKSKKSKKKGGNGDEPEADDEADKSDDEADSDDDVSGGGKKRKKTKKKKTKKK